MSFIQFLKNPRYPVSKKKKLIIKKEEETQQIEETPLEEEDLKIEEPYIFRGKIEL